MSLNMDMILYSLMLFSQITIMVILPFLLMFICIGLFKLIRLIPLLKNYLILKSGAIAKDVPLSGSLKGKVEDLVKNEKTK